MKHRRTKKQALETVQKAMRDLNSPDRIMEVTVIERQGSHSYAVSRPIPNNSFKSKKYKKSYFMKHLSLFLLEFIARYQKRWLDNIEAKIRIQVRDIPEPKMGETPPTLTSALEDMKSKGASKNLVRQTARLIRMALYENPRLEADISFESGIVEVSWRGSSDIIWMIKPSSITPGINVVCIYWEGKKIKDRSFWLSNSLIEHFLSIYKE